MGSTHLPQIRLGHHWLFDNSTPNNTLWDYPYLNATDDVSNSTIEEDVCPAQTNRTDPAVDPVVYIYASSFLIVICTVSLAVNVVILSSVCFMRSRIYPTLYISLSLAGADTISLFFYASGLLFFTLLPRYNIVFNTPCTMLLLEALRMGGIMTTLFHLVALAGNHYLGILVPFHYPIYMARRNIQYCIIVLWTIPSCLLVLDMFFLEGDVFKGCPHEFLKRSKFRTRFSIPFFTTLGMMIFIYLHIYKLVCKHQKQPLDGTNGRCHSTKRSRGYSSSQVNKKAIVTTLMILGSTILGWTPAFTYFALFCKDCVFCEYWNQKTPTEFAILLLINFLMIGKTATNSYIYAFRMKEIKVALRRMRRRLWRCPLNYREDTEQSYCTVSRQSTSRGRTCVYRMNSVQDSPNNNLLKETSLSRCRSLTYKKNKLCSTSV